MKRSEEKIQESKFFIFIEEYNYFINNWRKQVITDKNSKTHILYSRQNKNIIQYILDQDGERDNLLPLKPSGLLITASVSSIKRVCGQFGQSSLSPSLTLKYNYNAQSEIDLCVHIIFFSILLKYFF